MSSNVWMVLSLCPSDCGWYAKLICSSVPKASWKLHQNWEVNLRSLSDIIETGTPCSLTISLINNSVSLDTDHLVLNGRKWEVFISRSTITQTPSNPACVLGKPTTKSIVMCSHFHWGIYNSWSNSDGLWYSALIYWHVKHWETKVATCFFISGHQKCLLKFLYILVAPRWIANQERCPSANSSALTDDGT